MNIHIILTQDSGGCRRRVVEPPSLGRRACRPADTAGGMVVLPPQATDANNTPLFTRRLILARHEARLADLFMRTLAWLHWLHRISADDAKLCDRWVCHCRDVAGENGRKLEVRTPSL